MTKHVHHDLIVEWAKDTSRQLQSAHPSHTNEPGDWVDVAYPTWDSCLLYRFKPETQRYRVALFKGLVGEPPYTANADNKEEEKKIIARPYFIKWLTDWIEYEV